jgi:hypothetical protein
MSEAQSDKVTIVMDRKVAIEELVYLRLDGNRPHALQAFEEVLIAGPVHHSVTQSRDEGGKFN